MDLGLHGKTVLITGGTRGIGRTIVEAFAAKGCHVALCTRDGEGVRATVEALTRYGIKATGQAVDVVDGERLQTWIRAVARELGGLDILVANASGKTRPLGDAGWRRNFDIDVMGTVHAVEAARHFLEASSAAAVIVIASGAAFETFQDVFPAGELQPYAVMKAAPINYIGDLSHALAPTGIRANVVSPGAIYFPGGGMARREQDAPEVFRKQAFQE